VHAKRKWSVKIQDIHIHASFSESMVDKISLTTRRGILTLWPWAGLTLELVLHPHVQGLRVPFGAGRGEVRWVWVVTLSRFIPAQVMTRKDRLPNPVKVLVQNVLDRKGGWGTVLGLSRHFRAQMCLSPQPTVYGENLLNISSNINQGSISVYLGNKP
jgi:hypothetical protein